MIRGGKIGEHVVILCDLYDVWEGRGKERKHTTHFNPRRGRMGKGGSGPWTVIGHPAVGRKEEGVAELRAARRAQSPARKRYRRISAPEHTAASFNR